MKFQSSNVSSMRSCAFGQWILRGEWLEGGKGKGVHLPPKELAVLWILLDAGESLVSKDFLLENVWPGCDVAEESLTRCIYALRKVLGVDRHYIATVYGKGYRFVCPVIELMEPDAASLTPLFLVLPFRSDSALLSSQLHEQVTRALTNAFSAALRITPASLTAGQIFRGETVQVVDRLAPDYYLSGRCASVGDQIELSIELARSRDHALVHAQAITTNDIATALEAVVLMVAQRLPGIHSRGESCSSYPLALAYLNGLAGMQAYTPDSLREALRQFGQCVQLDENYAPPWCGIASAHLALASLGLCPEHRAFERSQFAIGKALALEPGNHSALVRLALLTSLQGQTDAAEALFQHSLLGGNHADAYFYYAWHQWSSGFEVGADQSIDISLSHDPESVAAKVLKLRITAHRQPKAGLLMIRQPWMNDLTRHPIVQGLAVTIFAGGSVVADYRTTREADDDTFDARTYWRLSSPGRQLGHCLGQMAAPWITSEFHQSSSSTAARQAVICEEDPLFSLSAGQTSSNSHGSAP